MMKRTFSHYYLLLCVTICSMAMVGCTKEGSYKPKKKIGSITETSYYYDYYGSERHEHWYYDQDDRLSKIEYHRGALPFTADFTEHFYYDNKDRIKKIECDYNGELSLFKYDGNKLSEIKLYYDNELAATYEFSHEGSKISMIRMDYNTTLMKSAPARKSSLRHVLPASTIEHIEHFQQKRSVESNTKSTATFIVKFKWDGNNIAKEIYEEWYDGVCDDTYTITYEYDKMKNPLKSLFRTERLMDYSYLPLSENNILKSYEDYEYETQYSYEYEDKYPIIKREYDDDGRICQTTTYSYSF